MIPDNRSKLQPAPLPTDFASVTPQQGATVKGELIINLPKKIYALHEPVISTIKWQITQGWLTALSTEQFYDFKISLLDNEGHSVPYTAISQRLCDLVAGQCDTDEIIGFGKRVPYRLDPEKPPYEDTLNVSELFNISEIGIYTLTVSTRNIINSSAMLAGLESPTRFVSQPVTFTIVAP
jgi:hypothetical protein